MKWLIMLLCTIPVLAAPVDELFWWWIGMALVGALVCDIMGVEI